MKQIEGKILSSDQLHELYYTLYMPEDNPIALVQHCHDSGEHMGYYKALAEDLTSKGIIVCGCDQLGHGKSLKEGEPSGCIGEGPALDTLIADQKLVYDLMRKKYRYLPYLLLGQGMGTILLCRFMSLYKETADGMILSSARRTVLSPVWGKITFALACMGKKKDQPAPLLEKKLFGKARTNCAFEDQTDLPSGFALTADGYRQLFEAGILIDDPQWALDIDLGLPVLLLAAEDDAEGTKSLNDRLLDAELCMQSLRIVEGAEGGALFTGEKKEETFAEIADFAAQVAEGVREARMSSFY